MEAVLALQQKLTSTVFHISPLWGSACQCQGKKKGAPGLAAVEHCVLVFQLPKLHCFKIYLHVLCQKISSV